MTPDQKVTGKNKAGWGKYARAFGRAHRKASVQLETSMPLIQHLDELRRRIFMAFFALVITTGISLAFAEQIIDYLSRPIGGIEKLVSIEVTENVAIFMKVSILGGFVLGMPFIVYQVLAFVSPGLNRREKGWLVAMVPLATLLFAAGVTFTWFILLPSAVPFLTTFLNITTQVRPANYFDFITRLMFWIGICFEMPLIFFFLAKLKFVSARQLASGWRYAIVVMAIVASAVTPTVDPVNMGLVMAPLMGLYLISIALAALAGKG